MAGGIPPHRINQYGAKGTIKYNPSQAESVIGMRSSISIVDWQAEDGRPCQVTVEAGILAQGGPGSFPFATDPSGNPYVYRQRCQVIMGSPGTMQDVFFIDLNRGQRFTATASYMAVSAEALAPPTSMAGVGGTTFVGGSVVAVGSIGYGIAISRAPTVLTLYADDMAVQPLTNSSIVFRIPPRANFLLPVYGSDYTGSFALSFQDVFGTSLGVLAFNSGQLIAPIPIPQDAFQVLLANTGATNTNTRLIFQISV